MLRLVLIFLVILLIYLFIAYIFRANSKQTLLRGGGINGFKVLELSSGRPATKEFISNAFSSVCNFSDKIQQTFIADYTKYIVKRVNITTASKDSRPGETIELIDKIKRINTSGAGPYKQLILAQKKKTSDGRPEFQYLIFIFNVEDYECAIIEPENKSDYSSAITAIYFVAKGELVRSSQILKNETDVLNIFAAKDSTPINTIYSNIKVFKKRLRDNTVYVDREVIKHVVIEDTSNAERLKDELEKTKQDNEVQIQACKNIVQRLQEQIQQLETNKELLTNQREKLTEELEKIKITNIENEERIAKYAEHVKSIEEEIKNKNTELEEQAKQHAKYVQEQTERITALENKINELKVKIHNNKNLLKEASVYILHLKANVNHCYSNLFKANSDYITRFMNSLQNNFELMTRLLNTQASYFLSYAEFDSLSDINQQQSNEIINRLEAIASNDSYNQSYREIAKLLKEKFLKLNAFDIKYYIESLQLFKAYINILSTEAIDEENIEKDVVEAAYYDRSDRTGSDYSDSFEISSAELSGGDKDIEQFTDSMIRFISSIAEAEEQETNVTDMLIKERNQSMKYFNQYLEELVTEAILDFDALYDDEGLDITTKINTITTKTRKSILSSLKSDAQKLNDYAQELENLKHENDDLKLRNKEQAETIGLKSRENAMLADIEKEYSDYKNKEDIRTNELIKQFDELYDSTLKENIDLKQKLDSYLSPDQYANIIEDYKELQEKLKVKDEQYDRMFKKAQRLTNAADKLLRIDNDGINNNEDALKECIEENKRLSEENERLKSELEASVKEIENMKDQLEEANAKCVDYEAIIETFETNRARLEEDRESMQTQYDELQDRLNEKEAEIERLRMQLTETSNKFSLAINAPSLFGTIPEITPDEADITKLKDEYEAKINELEILRQEMKELQEQIERIELEKAEIKDRYVQEIECLKTELELANDNNKKLKEIMSKMNDELNNCAAEKEAIKNASREKLANAKAAIKQAVEKYTPLIQGLQACGEENKALKEQLENNNAILREFYNSNDSIANENKQLQSRIQELTKENTRLGVELRVCQEGSSVAENIDSYDETYDGSYSESYSKENSRLVQIDEDDPCSEHLKTCKNALDNCYAMSTQLQADKLKLQKEIDELTQQNKLLKGTLDINNKVAEKHADVFNELNEKLADNEARIAQLTRQLEETSNLKDELKKKEQAYKNLDDAYYLLKDIDEAKLDENKVTIQKQRQENESLKREVRMLKQENDKLREEILPVDEVVKYVEKPIFVNASPAKKSIVELMKSLNESYNNEDIYRLKHHQLILRAKSSFEFPLSEEYIRPLYTTVNTAPKDFSQIKHFTTLHNAINQLSSTGYLLIYKLKNGSTVITRENSGVYTLSDQTISDGDAKIYAIIDLKSV